MGTMSASDAAPLPRLGEVFFDVRGNTRSMRLSWYADTQVAVFSIWQGGMCTGTFRLAIADLPRMVDTLQRGPGGQQAAWDTEQPGGAFAGGPAEGTSYTPTMGPPPGQMPADFRGGQPDYGTGVRDYPGEPLAEPAVPPGAYLADPPAAYPADAPGQQVPAAAYPADLPGQQMPAAAYPADPPGQQVPADAYLAGPRGQQGGVPGYRGGRSGDSAPARPAPPDYLAEGPGLAGRVPGYVAAPDHAVRPAEQRTEYLADLPPAGSPDPPGYGGAFPPGGHPGVSYAAPAGGMAYPHESGRQGGYPAEHASDPYVGGMHPMHYQAEPSAPHHQARSSQPARADALGPATADYPAHYDAAVTDDIGDARRADRPADSPRYGQRRDGR
jgi:hypothetical protein